MIKMDDRAPPWNFDKRYFPIPGVQVYGINEIGKTLPKVVLEV